MFGLFENTGNTQMFGSTAGAQSGCTRLQATGGNPGDSSVAAAKGDAGHMMVPIKQTGGVGYSVIPSTGLMAEHQTYQGDAMRSDLNPQRAIGGGSGGSGGGGRRRRVHRRLASSIGNVGRRGARTLKRMGNFGFKSFKNVVGRSRNVARAATRPLTRKYRKSLASLKRRSSRRALKGLKRSGLRRRFFAGNNKKRANNNNNTMRRRGNKNMRGGNVQYMNNTPFSMGYGMGNVSLSSTHSALANPAPMSPYVSQ